MGTKNRTPFVTDNPKLAYLSQRILGFPLLSFVDLGILLQLLKQETSSTDDINYCSEEHLHIYQVLYKLYNCQNTR